MRKSIEFGTIVGGNKGFFIDYTTSARMFLKYLPTTEKMIFFSCYSSARQMKQRVSIDP
jgi:hypothetical protein